MTLKALLEAYSTGERDFRSADLSGQKLDGETLARVDLSNANLTEASFVRANLYGANLQKANLAQAKLCNTNLKNANLIQASLQKANLQFADFSRAQLAAANFSDADLRGADLSTAQFEDPQQAAANFSGAIYDEFTLFPPGIDPIDLGFTKNPNVPTNSASSRDSNQSASSSNLNQLQRSYDAAQAKSQQLEADVKQLKVSAQNYLDRQASISLELEQQISEKIQVEEALETTRLKLQVAQQELDHFRQTPEKDITYPAFPWILTIFLLVYCYLGFLWSSRLPQPINPNNINYAFLVPEISLFLASWAGFLLSNSKKSFLGYVALLGAIATVSLPVVINYSKLFLSATNFFSIVFFAAFILIIDIVIFIIARRQRWGKSISQFNFIRTLLFLTLFGISIGALVYFYRRIF
ncbi:MAG: pentapeptide repeat-containing protein [Aphanocapsa sp. GSE-SYN-MK-11-07L]|jgi:ElaB/YqjD/DUF883 family membrane-anchored ribosome-binding protein|nr:pentapeptide repeat-containing protein [Aphanocapsa sp. GSE-SYN-MK-11-07L]